MLSNHTQSLAAIRSLACDDDFGKLFEKRADAGAHQRMIIYKENAYGFQRWTHTSGNPLCTTSRYLKCGVHLLSRA